MLSGAVFRRLLLLAIASTFAARADQTVFTDSLQNGWVNYSWATVNFAATSPVHSGAASISISSAGYQALYLHHTAQNGAVYSGISFWINGGSTGGQSVRVQATRNGDAQTNIVVLLSPLPANSWRQETIPLSSLEVATATDFDGFWLQPGGYCAGLVTALAGEDGGVVGPVPTGVTDPQWVAVPGQMSQGGQVGGELGGARPGGRTPGCPGERHATRARHGTLAQARRQTPQCVF